MRRISRIATIATAAVTALGGVACGSEEDGGTSPGVEEAPPGDSGEGEDDGLY